MTDLQIRPVDPLLASGRHSRSGHSGRRHVRRVGPRTTGWMVVVVIVTLVGIGVIDANMAGPRPIASPGSTDGTTIAPASSSSSSAFCVGGASGFGGLAGTTIYLTNTTSKTVAGVMTSRVAPGTGSGATSSGTPGPSTRRQVEVPPMATAAVNPGAGLPAGDVATSFVFAGGGVTANQVLTGANGWSTSACASQTSSSWYFAGGSTTAQNSLTLDLFNPTSTDAVINVSFFTTSGVITPSNYQGLVVPAGEVLAENIGDFVQNDPEIATVVSAQSTAIVANEAQQWSAGSSGGMALRLGSPSLSTAWNFAQTTNSTGGTVTFHLANPGATAATATFNIGFPMASVVPIKVPVPARSEVTFIASDSSRIPRQVAYAVTVVSTGAIAVSRSVQATAGSTLPVWGASTGTTMVANHWLVPAPGAGTAPGTPHATVVSLGIANPGLSPARVVVTMAGTGAIIGAFTVAPGSLVVLGSKLVGGLQTFAVSATQPVSVEEGDGPSGTPGIVSSTGMPFAS